VNNDVVIQVENLSKAYRIGLRERQHETMLGAVAAWAKSPLRNFREVRNLSRFEGVADSNGTSNLSAQNHAQSASDLFWALKDISFEVKRGEAIGVIGRNGAGKSTLLKILSRVTEPTAGRARIHGRVGSLLEVGTGFHPDLTGRENVYLNGTILGMKKREIDASFDEIVGFSGVDKFIDTPVKRYSSGMRVRLAFSVAAHLNPEVMIVDEVLAVGDAEFQKRCLGKMGDLTSQGRTVLFVSHNMSAVQALCGRCVRLRDAKLTRIGPCAEVVAEYLLEGAGNRVFRRSRRGGSVYVESAVVLDESPHPLEVEIAVELHSNAERRCTLDVRVADMKGQPVAFGSLGSLDPNLSVRLQQGRNDINLRIPTDTLAQGSYFVSLDVTHPDAEYYDRVENCLMFDVVRLPRPGAIRILDQKWGYGCLELDVKPGVRNGAATTL
jgi:lipopolysaccharide transport system ATP-binding protein